MMRIFGAIVVLGACASGPAPSTGLEARSCAALPGWAEVADASRGRFLIFGETHGTQEAPRAVQEFVCEVADRPVLLAIELDSKSNAELQEAWTGAGQTRAGLLEKLRPLFAGRLDGVGSQAMLDMLGRLFELRQAGAEIDIVAFSGVKDAEQAARFAGLSGQEPHEAAQAENIRNAAAMKPYAHVVVLVGTLHAQKTVVEIGATRFEPMAMKLAQPDQVIALRMRHAGGAAWNCRLRGTTPPVGRAITQSDLDCGAHPIGSAEALEPGMALARLEDGAFDGHFAVGAITASAPP